MLEQFKVRTRLAAGFFAVFLLVGLASVAGIWKLVELGGVIDALVTDHAAKLAHAQRWEKHIATNIVRTRASLLVFEPEVTRVLAKEMAATSQVISEIQAVVEKSVTSDEDKQALAVIGEARARYREKREALLKSRAGGEDVADELNQKLEPLAVAYLGSVEAFVKAQEQDLEAARAAAEASVRRTRALMIALVSLGFVVALLGAAAITRSIVAPIAAAREEALRMAAGDLTSTVTVGGRDEIAEMMRGIAQMQQSLRGIAAKVRSSSEAVSSAASEIAAGNGDLSSRTEEQASSLEETAASIEQMTATVNQNAQNASQAAGVAIAAAEVARKGGVAVDEVVKMMEGIQESSRRIGEITGVIDSIAFQTNILALNAAVEAARAGDEGRGFAVVASEVRTLAQRSAAAAREIKGLITDSTGRVQSGARIADDAGRTMGEVVASVSQVSRIIGEIASATSEQSTGIAQVNQAVADLDKVTQSNASLVEESTAASESLRELAEEMSRAVSVFRLDRGHAALPAPYP
jgi:methyl-accepting chemotaxis protein